MSMGSMINVENQSRIGEIAYNNFGSKMKIIKYTDSYNIDVYFEEYDWVYYNARYGNFKKGSIRCPYEPTFMNKGFIGEGKYNTIANKESFEVWRKMIRRCYDVKEKIKHPTYEKAEVCKEWLNFQSFAKWYEENYYECNNEKMDLDKDILVKGNKTYSPSTCIFVPHKINTLFVKKDENRGQYPIGVSWNKDKNKFTSRCSNGYGKYKHLGYYNTSKEAFESYKIFKEKVIKQVADEYKPYIPKELYEAMYRYEVEIDD